MENTIKLINLAYVKNFKCDGQRCGAKCCRRWQIDIDAETFKKYEKIESAEKEFTSHIFFNETCKSYNLILNEKNSCPFLTAENLCGIQKNTAKIFYLSCASFIRVILKQKNLSIDQRLAVLGFFWQDIDKIIKADKLNKIAPLAKTYMSPNFWTL